MKIFNSSESPDPLIKLLAKSRTNFSFNKKNVRAKLMSQIEEQQLTEATLHIQALRQKSFVKKHAAAVSIMILVLVIASSSMTVSRANVSIPGDKLHMVEQLQEKLMLKLPLPDTQKASIQAKIVEERNRELEHILKNEDQNNVKAQAINESVSNYNRAMEQALLAKQNYIGNRKKENEEKIDLVITKLEVLAEQQEKKIISLIELEKDETKQTELNTRLEDLRKTRNRNKEKEESVETEQERVPVAESTESE